MELYKKLRPKRWEDLVGQSKVASTLKAAVSRGEIPTAYLFLGERGTGKTSSAFILAKAVNCENVSDGNPCNSCDSCLSIDSNSHIGVHYISMANYGSVAEVREIVEKAALRTEAKKQVWILDEAHNLSKPAWDSLLIPLESSTTEALFIFCSTEANKIPETIQSRVQARKFLPVNPEVMSEYLKKVSDSEGLNLTAQMIDEAVLRGRGSVRDTLTSLDSILSGDAQGSTEFIGKLLLALSSHDVAGVLSSVAEAEASGVDGRLILEDLFKALRNLILLSSNVDRSLIGSIPVEPAAVMPGLYGQAGVVKLASMTGEAISRMSFATDAKLAAEIALVDMVVKMKSAKRR